MAKFVRLLQLDDDQASQRTFEAPSPTSAIKQALEDLQRVVETRPHLSSAAIVIGEGTSDTDVKWFGGWVWREAEGFVWKEPD